MAGTESSKAPPLIALAVVTRPHGVRGELRLKRYNLDSDLLFQQSELVLRRGAELRTIRVLHIQPHQEMAIARLAGIDTREGAETLRGAELCVPRTALPELPAGEYYHADVVGLTVREVTGRVVGRVLEVYVYPAADTLRVQTDEGVREVPWIDPYVVDVSLDRGEVVVDHWEDLPLEPTPRARR